MSGSWLTRATIWLGPKTTFCFGNWNTRILPYWSPSLRATIHAAMLFLPRGVNGSIWMNSARGSPGRRIIV